MFFVYNITILLQWTSHLAIGQYVKFLVYNIHFSYNGLATLRLANMQNFSSHFSYYGLATVKSANMQNFSYNGITLSLSRLYNCVSVSVIYRQKEKNSCSNGKIK